jgi:hypothetical protein
VPGDLVNVFAARHSQLRFGDSVGALSESIPENTAIIIANAIEILCGFDSSRAREQTHLRWV